jgi:TolA-binding protein
MFDIALNENGSNEEALLGKALVFRQLGEDNKAYDLYEYFLKFFGAFSSYSNDVRASYLTQVYESGMAAYRRGEHRRSIGFFERLLNFFPVSDKTVSSLYWIGENHYSLKNYNTALTYFRRVLAHNINTRDEDARIKSGYSYFMMRRFDLAAREFQIYMRSYPKGRHIVTARRWHDMSIRELEFRLGNTPTVRTERSDRANNVDNIDDDDNEDNADRNRVIIDEMDEDLFDDGAVSNPVIPQNNDPLRDLIEL